MELISVIVPVYKAEKYLNRCIESIVDQTYTNLEIILVDDGSPDRCPEICNEWALKDSRIKVIHQKNGGGGQARNVALDIAKGNWIAFVDSDDYIDRHMYEILYSLTNKDVDVVECQIILTDSDNVKFDNHKYYNTEIYSTEEALKLHIKDQLFRQTPPNKLYRKETVADIRFPIGKLIDDEFWTYRVLGNARLLISTQCKLYAYRQQEDSVMHKRFSINRLQAIEAKCDRLKYLEKEYPCLVTIAKVNLIMTCLFLGQMSLKYLNKKQQVEAFNLIAQAQKNYDLRRKELQDLPLKNRIWIYCSKISFRRTCTLRNLLKKGI